VVLNYLTKNINKISWNQKFLQ